MFKLESSYRRETPIGIKKDKLKNISKIPKRFEIAFKFIRF
jgi:hypothetical protein